MIIQPQILTTQAEAPGPDDGEWLVNFFDYDGTLVSTQYVDTGGDATSPTMPAHSELTFLGFNNSLINIQADIDIGAEYTTADGKTHAHLRLTTVSGLGATLYFNKDDGSTLTVDWGDETSDDYTNTGNFNTGEHVYVATGDYVVKIWISSGSGKYELSSGTSATPFCGGSIQNKRSTLVALHVATGITELKSYALYYHDSMERLSLPPGVLSLGLSCMPYCRSLQGLVIPGGVTTLGASVLSFCYKISAVVFPYSLSSTGGTLMSAAYNLAHAIVPPSLLEIEASMFTSCYGMRAHVLHAGVIEVNSLVFRDNYSVKEFVFLSTTPPISGTQTFLGINKICKIYVPDASVATYKAATNWATYSDYIYPLSDRP